MFTLNAHYNILLLVLFVALQLFDFYSTWRVLTVMCGLEKNPVMKHLMTLIGIVPALSVKTLFTCSVAGYLYYYNATMVLIAAVLFYALVALNNYKVMNRG